MCLREFHNLEILTNATNLDLVKIGGKWLNYTESRTKKSLCNFINLKPGLNARIPKCELESDNIRKLHGVSNSELTRFMHKLKGETVNYPARALTFGAAFHEMVLEPQNFSFGEWCLRKSENAALIGMENSLLANDVAFNLLQNSEKEVNRTWIDKKTGLKCKGRIDLDISKTDLGDLKTTSANSLQEFERDLVKYDNDRQAAFYLSGTKGARRFWFIGIQKRKPYRVFVTSFYRNSKFIRKGKRKMDFLLERYKRVLD